MNTIILRIAFILFMFIPYVVFSKKVTVETARLAANNIYRERCAPLNHTPSDLYSLDLIYTEYSGNNTIFYVFQAAGKKGFVIIAADDRAFPILGYTYYEDFPVSVNDRPPAFVDWVNHYSDQISRVSVSSSTQEAFIGQVWSYYASEEMDLIPVVVTDTLPLSTKWGQGCYYNEQCPVVSCSNYCNHAVTGCAAIAAAQVLNYLHYPPKGLGLETYQDPLSPDCTPPEGSLGILSVDFSSHTYDWSQMPDIASSPNAEMAKLIYDLGVGNRSNYSCCETYSYPDTTRINLAYHFGMDYNITLAVKSDYSDTDWENMIMNNIQNNSPVIYRGALASGAGHGFVCYGYQTTPFGNMFLFNWGWDGMADGFYYLNDLTPAPGTTFAFGQAAIVGIKPGDDLMFTYGDISQTSLNPGNNFTVSYTVLNQGVGPAPPAFVKVYFSQNSTFEPETDIEVASALLPLLDTAATQTINQAVTVPSGLSSGPWYVLLVIDPDNQVREVYEVNNTGYFTVQIGSLLGLNESFEGDFLPSGWMKYNPDGGSGWNQQTVGTSPVPGWSGGTLTAIPDGSGGSKMAFCNWSTGGNTHNDQWLVTPLVNIAAGYELSFWFGSYSGYIDTVDVLLSITTNQMAAFTTLLTKLTFSMVTSGWAFHTVNLAPYAGQNIYIAFREHVVDNYYNGAALFLDKVRIGPPVIIPAYDAGITALITPVSGPGLSTSEQVTVTIQNFGTTTLTNIPVFYKLNNNTPVSKTWTGSLSQGNAVNVTFLQPVNLSQPGITYTLKCWTALSTDQEHSNDTLVSLITNTAGIYCAAGSSICDEFISNVSMLGSSNPTACSNGGYANYTNHQFTMSSGQTATLSIQNGPPAYIGDVCGVWVDWNGNAIFTDDPAVSVIGGPIQFSATITVPQNVPSGPVRLRIRIGYNETPLPCEIAEYGEVEDYTILVTQVFSDDAGVNLLLKPITGMDLPANSVIKTRIKNYGNHVLTNLPVTYQINTSTPVTENITGPLLPGDSTDFTFSTPADLSNQGIYTLKVYTDITGDVQHNNDTITKQITNYHFGNQLFNSGPVMNSPGTGYNNADESTVQLSIGLTSFGYYTRISSSYSVAEDFTVPPGESWDIDGLLFVSYQTGSTTTSPMTWVRFRIWDAPPPGGNLIFGNNYTNRLTYSFFSNIYRVYDTASGENSRPLFYDYCTVSPTLHLNPGTYWVEWETTGNLLTGPFVPPVTVNGQLTTGNARQRHDSIWINLVDGGSQTFQGLPLKVFGNNQPEDNASLTGTVTYLNPSLTPLNNTKVSLFQGSQEQNYTYSGIQGEYLIDSITAGNFTVKAASTKPWSGGNAVDALKILQHFAGLYYLSGLNLKAADVDNSGSQNAVDALMTAKRFVGIINSFPAGDWIFNTDNIQINQNENKTFNFNGLCMGDVDGSYFPAAKGEPYVTLEYFGEQSISGPGSVVIPITAGFCADLGSLSLILDIPENQFNLMNVAVSLKAPKGGSFLYSYQHNQLRLAWYCIEPWQISSGDLLFTLTANTSGYNSSENITIEVADESIFTDNTGYPLTNMVIKIPRLKYDSPEMEFRIWPNPATTQLNIQLPDVVTDGAYLEINDLTGRLLMIKFIEGQTLHHLTLTGFTKGIYFLKISNHQRTFRTIFMIN